MAGKVEYPKTPVLMKLQASAQGDDGPRIEQALKELAEYPLKNGLRGALLLEAGVYRIEKPILLNTDGIILRGEGTGSQGTRIHFFGQEQESAILLSSTLPDRPPLGTEDPRTYNLKGDRMGRAIPLLDSYAPTGRDFIQPMPGHGLKAGDTILLEQQVNTYWLYVLKMDQQPSRKEGDPPIKGWNTHDFRLQFEKTITRIEGGRVFLDTPLVNPINIKTDTAFITHWAPAGRVSNVAVENLSIIAHAPEGSPRDARPPRVAIRIDQARDCWISQVDSFDFAQANVVTERDSRDVTIDLCGYYQTDPEDQRGLRQGFAVAGHGILTRACVAQNVKLGLTVEGLTAGPNIFTHCYVTGDKSQIGPWRYWSMGTLYDNIKGRFMNASNRGLDRDKNGWTSINTLYWNCIAPKGIRVQSPINGWNWAIGCTGDRVDNGYPGLSGFYDQLHGEPRPQSLYLQLSQYGRDASDKTRIPDALMLKNLYYRFELAQEEATAISQLKDPRGSQ